MSHAIFGYLSGICIVLTFVPYTISIFRGQARPERASWFIWAVLGGITFSAQLFSSAKDSLWLPGLQTIGDAFIFLLSIKFGIGGFARRDKISLGVAAASLVFWYLTNNPLVALFVGITIDAIGVFLTVWKNTEHPETESDLAWILTALAGLLAIFSVDPQTPVLFVYPVYIFLAGAIILASSKGLVVLAINK